MSIMQELGVDAIEGLHNKTISLKVWVGDNSCQKAAILLGLFPRQWSKEVGKTITQRKRNNGTTTNTNNQQRDTHFPQK